MKRLLPLFALATLLAAPAAAETLDEILARHFEALGGREKIAAVQSARFSGKQVAGAMEIPLTIAWKRPNRMRVEFTMQGMTGIQAFDGTVGWMVMPFLGKTEPEAMSPEDLAQVAEQADVVEGALFDWQDKGHQVELVGRESVEGTDAWKLKVTRKGGGTDLLWLEVESMLAFKAESKRIRGGQEMEVESSIGDYKEVGGLLFPHSIEQRPKGAPAGATIVFDRIELDVELDDAQFAMPAPAAAAAVAP